MLKYSCPSPRLRTVSARMLVLIRQNPDMPSLFGDSLKGAERQQCLQGGREPKLAVIRT